MPGWDPSLYLAYESERARPFLDLVARVPIEPRTIVDLGCGPGHLSGVLRHRWPDALISGVDSSPEMIEQARRDGDVPGVSYALGDIATWEPSEPVDLVVSNAAFQWVPRQLEVVPRLRRHVAPGGVLAFQVPDNHDEPNHVLLRELAGRAPYAAHTAGLAAARGVSPAAYLERLVDDRWDLDVWGTTYFHVLDGEDPVFRWISGTGARPVLQALPDDLRARFTADYKAALRDAYPRREYGTVLPFPRTFVVAKRRV
ncbi:methyltransferase domain-containing protein [Mumia zhuanghuii]|uniref:Methyltransferase domain-containing protein n=2 Tax=Mumia TaxID=1546255 RepID=A0ABW1QGG5_9ACTN|nr:MULTISPECIES: methyltransferase domain-containing protein [Mumia]KAA1422797.1 methyltransferase domain-containing protein [Mumia zhuanghuii]